MTGRIHLEEGDRAFVLGYLEAELISEGSISREAWDKAFKYAVEHREDMRARRASADSGEAGR